ncbi:uncharacterized protein PFLUO_LOCUS4198 [Penicillium psychrofluorescens]|uniref:uncharacterized protein n=1 Tax=Penicillium psychrofluorescens TaxID=3158075 RepID=UPI003CCD7810
MDEGPDQVPRRKRVSRACDRCRSKKDKCDGVRPTCSACQASGQTCSYDPHAKKRGLPEGYVRGLEKLWALALCNIEGFEDTMLSMLGTTTDSANRRGQLMSLWTDGSSSDSLHEAWKTSGLYGELEKMLSSSEAPRTPLAGKRSRNQHDDDGGKWGFRVARGSTPLGPEAPRVLEPSSRMSPGAKRARRGSNGRGLAHSTSSSLPTLQLPPQTAHLLDIYFATTHSWFPIVAKHNILRASYLYANAPFSVASSSPGSGDHAVLWAILSYTITQSQTTPRADPTGVLSLVKEYYAVSRSLIPSEKERYELGHVQALLLLTLVNMGIEDWNPAWLLCGQAHHMAVAMGLGASSDTQRSDEFKQGKAVFLGCFVVDSLLSFRLSRSPCMHSRDLGAVGLLEEDGLEEWNSWSDLTGAPQGKNPPRRGPLLALSCFNRLVELASVLNDARRSASTGPEAAAFAQQLVVDLKQWDGCLPLGCRLIGPESIYPERHSALLPHQSYLGLAYLATLLWLYLRIAPQEQGLHRPQRPAVEGAKKLLYRVLPIVSQHLENFPMCGLPPLFEFSMHTITTEALTFHNTIESDTFPFVRWADALHQKTAELSPMWPVYHSLVSTIERWQQSKELPGAVSSGSQALIRHTPGLAPLSQPPLATDAPMHPPGAVRGGLGSMGERDYGSSVMGISIPADGQYMTPKDSMMDILSDKIPPRSGPDPMFPPGSAHPQPPTPDSSTSNAMMAGNVPPSDGMVFNPTSTDYNAGDMDAIFKDLAYLDTTEWATSREAGLKDFGFLDDSTFQAFCHDPDRLAGSQPLVHPPSIADMWPPPRFFPETFQEVPDETMGGG